MKHVAVEVLFQLRIPQDFGMVVPHIFARRDQKAACSTSRIADHVGGCGSGKFNHQLNDVPGRTELAVLSRRGDLAQHVFVQVAFGVPLFHRHRVDHVHDLGQ